MKPQGSLSSSSLSACVLTACMPLGFRKAWSWFATQWPNSIKAGCDIRHFSARILYNLSSLSVCMKAVWLELQDGLFPSVRDNELKISSFIWETLKGTSSWACINFHNGSSKAIRLSVKSIRNKARGKRRKHTDASTPLELPKCLPKTSHVQQPS